MISRAILREFERREIERNEGSVTESLFVTPLREDMGNAPLVTPEAAIEFFKSLVPSLGIEPVFHADLLRRQSFTLAQSTDLEMVERIKNLIQQALETGREIRATPQAISDVLDAAGVSSSNPQYAEMVFRTNYLDAVNTGGFDEMSKSDTFPCWKYSGIPDNRIRPAHAVHVGKYYPKERSFASVRDSVAGRFDGYNCRCTFIPVSKWQWKRLQAQGAVLAN